jgi:hypothetical protein
MNTPENPQLPTEASSEAEALTAPAAPEADEHKPTAENSTGGTSDPALAATAAAADAGQTDASATEQKPDVARAEAVAEKLVETTTGSVDASMCPSPLVAGEDQAEFRKIADGLAAEYKPQTLHSQFLVDDIAHAQWKIRRFRQSDRWLTNAVIAKSLQRQVVNKTVVETTDKNRAEGKPDPARSEQNIEQTWRQGWWLYWENTVFSAVSGDAGAIDRVERQLGRDAIGFNAFMDFDALSASQILLERAAMPVRAIRDSGFRMLDKIEKKRRQQAPKITVDPTASGNSTDPDLQTPRDPASGDQKLSDPTVTVHAPKGNIDGTDGGDQ